MKATIIKYSVAIIICEMAVFFLCLGLGSDADVSGYESVKRLLNSASTSQNPDALLASSAIRNASSNVHIMTIVVLFTSSLVMVLAFLIGYHSFTHKETNKP